MKIIILVLSKEDNLYSKLENTIRETWGSYKSENIDIFYYYGDGDYFKVCGDKIYTTHIESIYNIGYKTIDSFEYLSKNIDFDYVYRTNSSSYLNINKMIEFLKGKPVNNFYCAMVNVEKKSGIKFGSGSGYFLSKDLVEFVIKNKNKWDHSLIDDVALGDLLLKNGFKITPSTRLDINGVENGDFLSNSNIISKKRIDSNFHFRCKCLNREIDSEIMRKLYKYFN